MRALVSFERVIGVEAFLADVARKRARILVDVSDVFQLAGFGFERSSAHIAQELTIVGVHGHMFGQVTLKHAKDSIDDKHTQYKHDIYM